MARSFLENILTYKHGLVEEKKAFFSSLKRTVKPCDQPGFFKQAVSSSGDINLIAEIKKASPSKGCIRKDFDPVAIAKIYTENNAAAISVLTEDKYFWGQPEFMKQVTSAVKIPVLTKDFIIDAGQIYEARSNGAHAILLIVAILDDEPLTKLINIARSLALDCLVEVHDETELNRACVAGAEIIGINNRDLRTFEVDINTCKKLIPKIPKNKVIIAESGIQTYRDVQMLKELGAHAVLIGETFMREQDIGAKIKEVMHG